ncbi:MAG: signal peptidase I [Myxococcales bacterium]|nr:signal peptidase I [Myxococcales bacterium]
MNALLNPFSYLRRRKMLKALAALVKTAKKLLGKPLDVRAKHREALEAALEEGERVLGDPEAELETLEKAGEALAKGIYDSSFRHHVMSPRLKSILELVILLLAALTIRAFLYEPFKIPTGSMKPTLLHGDHVFIRKFHYGPRWPFSTKRIWSGQAPARGDVAVFNNPVALNTDYIKRIVAVEGDRVKVVGGHLFVNDQPQPRRSLGTHTLLDTDEVKLTGKPIQAKLYQEQSGNTAHYSLLGPASHRFYNDWPMTYFRDRTDKLYRACRQFVGDEAACIERSESAVEQCYFARQPAAPEPACLGELGQTELDGCLQRSATVLENCMSKVCVGAKADQAGRLHCDNAASLQPQPREPSAIFMLAGRGLTCRPDYCEVQPGYVFTMGDNRDGSSDSRAWGAVPVDYLRGKASVIWLSHDWTQPVIPMGPLTLGQLRWSRMFSAVDDLGLDLSAPAVKP